MFGKLNMEFSSKYVCEDVLQNAIFGNVLLCKHKGSGELKAVKALRKDLLSKSVSCDRIPVFESAETEITVLNLARQAPHENILQLSELIDTKDVLYVVTPYCAKSELFKKVEKGPLEENTARAIFIQVLKGAGHLHKLGYVHNDLSLENILLTENDIPKIIDFGLASKIGSYGMKRGKPQYQAPEVLFDNFAADPSSDVFSLGVCLFIMLTGIPPYNFPRDDDPRFHHIQKGGMGEMLRLWGVSDRVSQSSLALLNRMLSRNPRMRPTIEECLNSDWVKEGLMVGVRQPHDSVSMMDVFYMEEEEEMEEDDDEDGLGYMSLEDEEDCQMDIQHTSKSQSMLFPSKTGGGIQSPETMKTCESSNILSSSPNSVFHLDIMTPLSPRSQTSN